MNGYRGRHAELYDIFYADKPYRTEAEFIRDVVADSSGGAARKLLEIGCGTGGHALHLADSFEIVAIDASDELLRQGREKAARSGKSIDFRRQDMRALQIGEQFDVAVALFNTVGYLLTLEDLLSVLVRLRSHLRPAGLFLFDFWNPEAMLEHHEPVRVRRRASNNGQILRISETSIDRERQLVSVAYTIFEPSSDGHYMRYEETQVNRYFCISEINALLEQSGFTPLRFYSDFSPDAPITDKTWRIVALARATEALDAQRS